MFLCLHTQLHCTIQTTIILVAIFLRGCLVESMLSEGRVPGGAKDVEGLGEDVVVDQTSVDGEQTHQEHNVATIKYCSKHLVGGEKEE